MEARLEAGGNTEPAAALEMALIEEYLSGHIPERPLTSEQVKQRWRDALLYAALKLEEMTARAHLVDGLRGQSHVK